jgi:phosphoribosylanthranilate isomerase
MTWIKICGITNLEDALTAVDAGADAVGFVFYEKSPRHIDPDKVRQIVREIPAGIEKVGVFVNQTEDTISRTAQQAGLTAVQMHGDDEDPHVADLVAQRSRLKIFAAIAMNGPNPQGWAMTWKPDVVHGFLLDSGGSSMLGGTGKTFDWHASVEGIGVIKRLGNVVVAGGLNSGNVCEAMQITTPWGVDVSSGVESKPGKKDPEQIRAFIKAVRDVDKANSRN